MSSDLVRWPSEDAELGKFLLPPVSGSGSWYPIIRESYTGAWQQGVDVRVPDVLVHGTVHACRRLIAQDISKMGLRLVRRDTNGIWMEHESPSFSPVLRKPNQYQTRIQFIEWWVASKLTWGNTYILKGRDARGVVTSLYILDPQRVQVLVSPDGQVFYELKKDNLSTLQSDQPVIVPAEEIIHDRMTPSWHPLVGMSPIEACALAAFQGLKIQHNSTKLFSNGAQPGGVLTAPGAIAQTTADRIKEYWDTNFSGDNVGKVAVLGDGLKYEPMAMKATDAQLIEQLKWTSEMVCSVFLVPAYMVGVGPYPSYNNVQALTQQYYSQCLQAQIEAIELLLDEGLGLLGSDMGTEFDLDDLLRMDTATLISAEKEAVGAGIKKIDEARKRLNLSPVEGGDSPYLQQQNYSLAALARRDQTVGAPNTPSGDPPPTGEEAGAQRALLRAMVRERMRRAA